MARPHGYKRLTRKARHLIRVLRRSKHAGVQDAAVHELRHEINRRWWRRSRNPGPAPSTRAGKWRPPTRKAKRLLTHLRRTRVWKVQQRLVGEIERELRKGRRLADRIRESRVMEMARRGGRAAGRGLRAIGRGLKRAWFFILPFIFRGARAVRARAGGGSRGRVRAAQGGRPVRARTRAPSAPRTSRPPRTRMARTRVSR